MLSPATAAAQALPDPVQYLVAPQTPGPNQKVTIQAQGIGAFLGDADITWYVDGKAALEGIGASIFSFTTGVLGSQSHIQVKIVSHTQGTLTHDFVFLPSSVNLVWEADTSVPPFYRGKALYSAGSTLRIVAFPTVILNGARVQNSALSFQWSYNDEAVPSQSGLGRASFLWSGSELQPNEGVSVDIYYGASKVAHGEMSIPATEPQLLLYDKDPLRGIIYDAALPLGGIALAAKEFTIQAVPYFFSNASIKGGGLIYSWTLNDNDITGPDSDKGMLTLRQTGSGEGRANLGVSLQNTDNDKLVQAAQLSLPIVFGETANNSVSSFFGL